MVRASRENAPPAGKRELLASSKLACLGWEIAKRNSSRRTSLNPGGLQFNYRRMNLDQLLDSVPAYAQDLRLNLTNFLQQPELSKQQIWGTAVTAAITSRSPVVSAAITTRATGHLTPEAFDAARTAAAIMAMTNVYYRFQHFAGNTQYCTIPSRLRMNAVRSHGIEPVDFELYCIAASAINGCGVCIEFHEKVAREKGASEDVILGCVRIASVIHALATVFDAAPTA